MKWIHNVLDYGCLVDLLVMSFKCSLFTRIKSCLEIHWSPTHVANGGPRCWCQHWCWDDEPVDERDHVAVGGRVKAGSGVMAGQEVDMSALLRAMASSRSCSSWSRSLLSLSCSSRSLSRLAHSSCWFSLPNWSERRDKLLDLEHRKGQANTVKGHWVRVTHGTDGGCRAKNQLLLLFFFKLGRMTKSLRQT